VARCSTIIGRNKAPQENLKHYVRSCAQWLRLFHTMSTDNAGELSYDFSEYRASMSKIVQLLGDRGVDQDSLTFAMDSVKKALHSEQLAFSPSEVAYLHGDYQTKNVIISNGRVYCLDMDGQTAGLVYEDVARFLISLRITTSLMILHGLLLDDKLIEALQNEFLSGYFQNESCSTELLRLYLLKAVLQKWSRAALTVNHLKATCCLRRVILASIINPVFRGEIRKILRMVDH
jgi:aminoglycoside phosphotransferase (APT) family kinase protein